MSEESGFLTAIRADQEDDNARLVYADWLEERADVRAEYLRLDVECKRLQARLAELGQQVDSNWIRLVRRQQLLYNFAYHQDCELRLRSGRQITLESLDQRMTYAGLLEGTPNKEMNDRHVGWALQVAASRYSFAGRPHLIPPRRRDYLRQPGDMKGRRLPTEWLPMVQCIGSFRDAAPVRDQDKDASVLTVVWFQDEYALPIIEPALSQLLDLDWNALAVDVELR